MLEGHIDILGHIGLLVYRNGSRMSTMIISLALPNSLYPPPSITRCANIILALISFSIFLLAQYIQLTSP